MTPRACATESLRLENPRIAVEIDRRTGAIRSICDEEQGVTYSFSGIGFEVTTETGSVRSENAAEVKTGKDGAELRFTAGGLEIRLFYNLDPEDRFVEKWLEIKSEDGKPYFLKSVVLEDMKTDAFSEIHFHDDQTIWHCPINLFLRGRKGGCFAGIEYPYWQLEQKGKEGFRLGYQPNYQAGAGEVNTSDTPVGPFQVEGPREVGSQTGFGSDLNLFKDDNGKAYLVYTDHHIYDESRRYDKGKAVYAIRVDSLTDDYLHSNKEGVVAIASKGEAPAMAKYKGKYIVAASDVQGWNPTETRYVLADSPLGPYGKPAVLSEQKTWAAQITSFLYIKESNVLMAMCDQWWTPDKTDLNKSRYLWLPVELNPQNAIARMRFQKKWNPFHWPRNVTDAPKEN